MEPIARCCCFTGHRIEKLRCSEAELKAKLYHEIDRAVRGGIDTFYHGGCTGVDLIAAETVLLRRRVIKPGDPEKIRLIAVLPFEGQANRWSDRWRTRYSAVLAGCDEVITLQPRYVSGCYYARNRYMVDRCGLLIAATHGTAGGTAHTVACARQQNREVRLIAL